MRVRRSAWIPAKELTSAGLSQGVLWLKLTMNRQQLQKLSELRLREARALFAAGLPDGAYYLAGYAVECALKACIAKRTREHDFPDKKLTNESYTHSLVDLMRTAQLAPALKAAMQSNSKLADEKLSHICLCGSERQCETRFDCGSHGSRCGISEVYETASNGILCRTGLRTVVTSSTLCLRLVYCSNRSRTKREVCFRG
jgi:hypothetical protein